MGAVNFILPGVYRDLIFSLRFKNNVKYSSNLLGSESNFEFAVKFFEPNPEQLKNDYTRYSNTAVYRATRSYDMLSNFVQCTGQNIGETASSAFLLARKGN